jgi:uncharacterized iron-regulated membrane protein
MRKWHRWLSVIFGVFLLWIAVTGVLSQVVPIVQRGGFEEQRRDPAASVAPPGFACPETMTCRPTPKNGPSIVGLLHHLHSGESFGPLGTIVATLSGFAMIFFSFSGLWMYVDMFRRRKKGDKPGLFWK